jgi:hypothetical protein
VSPKKGSDSNEAPPKTAEWQYYSICCLSEVMPDTGCWILDKSKREKILITSNTQRPGPSIGLLLAQEFESKT